VPMLLELNEIVRNGVQVSRDVPTTLGSLQHVIADRLHLAVFEGSGQDTALPFNRPFANSFIYQKVE
jgi:hypothetical protein